MIFIRTLECLRSSYSLHYQGSSRPSSFVGILVRLLPVIVAVFLSVVMRVSSAPEEEHESPNPYARGCLQAKVPGWNDKVQNWRVCNSEDPPELRGVICQEPQFPQYLEMRLLSGNWNSAVALTWIVQIILSEMLGVPTTSEAGAYGETRNFYDYNARIDMNFAPPAESTVAAPSNGTLFEQHGGDCQMLPNTREIYTPCAHFEAEHWDTAFLTFQSYVRDNLLEPPPGLGMIGQEALFVTKFTAMSDVSLDSFFGLSGEGNRQKLATTFKRPTTWKEFCDEVSVNNCTEPDDTAQRYPEHDEGDRMFLEGLYTGYFRYTDANNCTLWPINCTGHVANYPCGWWSGLESNLYHLGIALDPNNGPNGAPMGYTSSQMVEMWHAANATRSDLMMFWWTPEPLYQSFLGTDAEMVPVMMPPYTLECGEVRADTVNESCEANLTARVGSPEASCGNPPDMLSKVITGKLHSLLHDSNIPTAAVNPAYEIFQQFRVSNGQMSEIFALWEAAKTPRDAICQWVVDNLDFLKLLVPVTYPRILQEQPQSAFGYAMIVLGAVAALLISATIFLVHKHSSKPAIVFAQLDFLYLLLVGSFLVSIGSILLSIAPSDASCISSTWFVNVGYTLNLAPLVIKVAAVNRMMAAASAYRRLVLNRTNLHQAVAGITLLLVIYLVIWTAIDPPHREAEYSMTGTETRMGETVVVLSYYCSAGDSPVWQYIAVGWNLLLLICASVLAIQTRHVVKTFNESRTLAFLAYSHCLFVILRIFFFVFSENFSGDVLNNLRSLLYCVDQMAGCVIYFLPKLYLNEDETGRSSSFQSLAAHRQSSRDPWLPHSRMDGAFHSSQLTSNAETPSTEIKPLNLTSEESQSKKLSFAAENSDHAGQSLIESRVKSEISVIDEETTVDA